MKTIIVDILHGTPCLNYLHPKGPNDNQDEQIKSRKKLVEGPLASFGRSIEAQLTGDGPFVSGDQLLVVDLKLYMILRSFVTGVYDHIPTNIFDTYPRLMGVYNAFKAHPKVLEWSSR